MQILIYETMGKERKKPDREAEDMRIEAINPNDMMEDFREK